MWYVPCWDGIKVVSMLYWLGWVWCVVWCVVLGSGLGIWCYIRLHCVVCIVRKGCEYVGLGVLWCGVFGWVG